MLASRGVFTEVEESIGDVARGGQQYSELELPIARACQGALKCSRGCMKLTLETCEELGILARDRQDDSLFDSISQVHELAREVGVGVTDLGSLMYPPLTSLQDLKEQLRKQIEAIISLQDFVLSLESMSSKITDLSRTLRTASQTRQAEFDAACQGCDAL